MLMFMASSTITDANLDAMTSIATWSLADGERSQGIAFLPVFANRVQRLYPLEHKIMEQILTSPVNVDHKFTIPFIEQHDIRDKRPMQYHGALISPGHIDLFDGIYRSSSSLPRQAHRTS